MKITISKFIEFVSGMTLMTVTGLMGINGLIDPTRVTSGSFIFVVGYLAVLHVVVDR